MDTSEQQLQSCNNYFLIPDFTKILKLSTTATSLQKLTVCLPKGGCCREVVPYMYSKKNHWIKDKSKSWLNRNDFTSNFSLYTKLTLKVSITADKFEIIIFFFL